MLKILLIVLEIGFMVFCNSCIMANEKIWDAIVVGRLSSGEALAVTDLQRYLGEVTGQVPDVINYKTFLKHPKSAIIIGRRDTNIIIADNINFKRYDIAGDGYVIFSNNILGSDMVMLGSDTEKGTINSIYGLLNEIGYGFYLGSEAVPESLPKVLNKKEIVKKPVFTVRGVLPWYNFFNSPTAWDPIDHRAFADQLIRSGANFLGFHTYDGEPFAGYEEDGKFKWGARLLNTSVSTWGTVPTKAEHFAYGTDKLYTEPFFGAKTSLDIKDDREAIIAEQDIMREALDYAKKRGLYTCIGFEINGDPVGNPEYRDIFIKRFNKLLDQYPSVDYIWIWQSETQGAQGFPEVYNLHVLPYNCDPKSPLVKYGYERKKIFKHITEETRGAAPFFQYTPAGELARAVEGARLEQFGWLAVNQLSQRKNAPKLVISGWGGDERLCAAEYYPGLDQLMPKDVVFSALDLIGPIPRVDKGYENLSDARERWPIPWLENDGDQWHTQPFVHIYEGTVRDAQKKGAQGILGIHWRTRDVEENFGYLMDYSWNEGLTAEEYFINLADRCYPDFISSEMADIHIRLDQLGYRWVGGGGQNECAPFTWGPNGDIENVHSLEIIRDEIEGLLPKAGKSQTRLTWLLDNINWTLQYDRAERIALKADSMLNLAEGESLERQKEIAGEVLDMMKGGCDSDLLGEAMRTFAKRISTRGEYGVLATINTKAYYAWSDIKNRALKMAGQQSDIMPDWKPERQIIIPRFISSVALGDALPISVISLGGGDVYIHYRSSNKKWNTALMTKTAGWVNDFTVSAKDIAKPFLRIKFSYDKDPEKSADELYITVMPKAAVDKTPFKTAKSIKQILEVKKAKGDAFDTVLKWEPVVGADYYRVNLNGKNIFETATPMAMVIDAGIYRIEAIKDKAVIISSEDIPCDASRIAVSEDIILKASVGISGVTIAWDKTASYSVMAYKVVRINSKGEEKVFPNRKASVKYSNKFNDKPDIGTWKYLVYPVFVDGHEGMPADISVVVDSYPEPELVFDMPLTEKPSDSKIIGNVQFTDRGAIFNDSYIEIPKKDFMDITDDFILEFTFNANSLDGMPVLISNGTFLNNGWFVQILNGSLMLRTAAGDFVGGNIEANKNYNVRFVYDYGEIFVFINGALVSEGSFDRDIISSDLPLTIGTYSIKEPQFLFNGNIKNLKIYHIKSYKK